MKEKDINELLGGMQVPARKSKEEAWKELQARLGQDTPVRSLNAGSWVKWAAAAAIIAMGVLWIANSDEQNTYFAESNEHIILPDGSEVDLRKGSTLSWDEEGWESHRTISLEGEAYFEVEKGSKFKVQGNTGTVEVLGTRFNVLNLDNALRVDCYSGKVRVSTESNEALLTKGMATKLNGKGLESPFAISAIDAPWVDGEFAYDRADLSQVFFDLEQQFAVQCDLPDLQAMEFTGTFSANSVEEALQIVCLPMGLSYEITEAGQIKVRKLIK